MKILSEIAQKTKARIEEQKSVLSKEELIKKAQSLNINYDFPFEKALAKKEMSFI